jgi:hypothetical protein
MGTNRRTRSRPANEVKISFLTPSKKPPYYLEQRVGDRLDRSKEFWRTDDRELRVSVTLKRLPQKERFP